MYRHILRVCLSALICRSTEQWGSERANPGGRRNSGNWNASAGEQGMVCQRTNRFGQRHYLC